MFVLKYSITDTNNGKPVSKIHYKDCQECTEEEQAKMGKIDRFERSITIEGDVSPEIADKIEEIANKCPVHRTLEKNSKVITIVN